MSHHSVPRSRLERYRTDRAVIWEANHPTPERIGEQVLEQIETIAQAHAEVCSLQDFMSPGAWADRQAKHRAVRNVLDRFEPSMVVTEELLDELIAAADTGI